jgi:hypothetical protein
LDGVNLLPFVTSFNPQPQARAGTGESEDDPRLRLRVKRPHEQLFWRAGPQHAVRVGDWKLVNTRTAPPMLFNLKDDIGEQHDLSASHPEKLKELQAAFAKWEQGTQPAKWVRQDQRNAEPGGKLKSDAGQGATPRRTPNAARIDEAFKTADKNNDGKLSRDEYPQPGVFNAVDANKDGFATPEEVRAYFRNRKGN